MKKLVAHFLLLLLAFTLSACGLNQKVSVKFETSEPLRVMVLPFVQTEDGEIIEEDADLFVDGVPLVSEKLLEDPPELLRQMVQSELSKTGLDVLAPYLVNVELPHHGYALPDGSFDLKKIYSTSPVELCKHFLDCDAVLYGWVTEWDRSYYGVQTVNSVTLKLKLVSARTRKALFETEVSNDDGRGLSGGPTGFSDIVIEPLKGLDSQYIESAARKVAEAAVAPLVTSNRADFTESPPPSLYAVAHNPLVLKSKTDKPLLVLAFAQPGANAYFSIGSAIKDFPMIEVEPSKYVGYYYPVEGEQILDEILTVALVDSFGRRTEQTSASGMISIK